MADSDPQNRRRSRRILLQVAILLRAELAAGNTHQVQAFTLAVNAHGGLLEVPLKLLVNQNMSLINPQTGESVGCKVVRVEGPFDSNYKIAFGFDKRNAEFWPVSFPPQDWEAEDTRDDDR